MARFCHWWQNYVSFTLNYAIDFTLAAISIVHTFFHLRLKVLPSCRLNSKRVSIQLKCGIHREKTQSKDRILKAMSFFLNFICVLLSTAFATTAVVKYPERRVFFLPAFCPHHPIVSVAWDRLLP